MTKLKLGPLPDDKPVKITVELPAPLHRDLVAYAEVLARQSGQPIADPVRLIVPMLERFIATDRGFAKSAARGKGELIPSTRCSPRVVFRLSYLLVSKGRAAVFKWSGLDFQSVRCATSIGRMETSRTCTRDSLRRE